MLIIALLKNIQQAVVNYRSRRQLKQLSKSALKDIAISQDAAIEEGKKANTLIFLKESFCGSLESSGKRNNKGEC